MKPIIVASIVLLAGLSSQAMAQCATATRVTRLTTPTIINALSGKLVCGRPAAGNPGSATDRLQEENIAGAPGATTGDLFDYKRGPGDPKDPREKVGTWTITSAGVTYVYTSGGTYVWTLHNNTTHFSFCTAAGGTEVVRAFIVTNTGTGCGGSFPP